MNISGEGSQGPVKTGVPIADFAASLYGTIGVMGALMRRARTGEGQLLKVSLLDAVMCLQTTHITEYFITGEPPDRCGNDSPFVYPVGVFKTADGYIALSAYNKKFWQRLCRALELNELVEDGRFDTEDKRFANRDELRPLLAERFSGRTNARLLSILEKEDVPCGPVHTYDSLFEDPQVRQNALIKNWPHALLGSVKAPGNPIRFQGSPVAAHSGPPVLGEHTDEVLAGLGFSEKEIGAFREKGIV
jgi:crotonobetainyl-CoA:carnitine CoA-transferase CaiB-like acyl-CoA transferase